MDYFDCVEINDTFLNGTQDTLAKIKQMFEIGILPTLSLLVFWCEMGPSCQVFVNN